MTGTLNDKQIDTLLSKQFIGRIGCHAGDKTYVVPVTYVLDGNQLICHSREGFKIDMMRTNPEVCFQVDEISNMANWQSIVLWGRFEELHGSESKAAMEKLINRLKNIITSETAHPHEPVDSADRRDTKGFSAVIYRIVIHQRTGRYEKTG